MRTYERIPWRVRALAGLLLILGGVSLLGQPAAPPHVHGGPESAPQVQGGTINGSFLETFNGAPTAPTAYFPSGWDVQIHSRDNNTWDTLTAMMADHGTACQAPPAQHDPTIQYPPHVFQCANHLMTSLYAQGYGVIYLTPPALLDWSHGTATVQWDMSTRRTSERDWVDLWITPVADHMALPIDDWVPDLAGAPENAIHFRETDGSIVVEVFTDGVQSVPPANTWLTYETVLVPDAARRDTFRVEVSNTHLKMWLPGYNLVWVDTDITALGWTSGVVQLGHHSYNPLKDCPETCTPNTWHWDNVSVSPALPLTISRATPRQVSNTNPGSWTFPAAAPAGSYLQFAANNAPGFVDWGGGGIGAPAIDLSFDGGSTWDTYTPQPSTGATLRDISGARSYWVPVPEGATGVVVGGVGYYGQSQWQAKDATVWQLSAVDAPTPVATPTPAPTNTAGPTPVVATPTPEATVTPVPSPTAGSSPTLVPTRTATPIATPVPGNSVCTVLGQRDGQPARVPWPFCNQ